MRAKSFYVAVSLALGMVSAARAAPGSDTYAIERIVRPSAFHGVHGLAFDANGALYAGSVAGSAIYRVDPIAGRARVEIGPPEGMADDLVFLADGTLVWTSINDGVVRARTGSGPIRVIASGLPGINSIAERTSDHRLFAAQVFAGDGLWELDPSGAMPARQILSNIGGLNGFDIGRDGMIYGPLWFKHQIVRIDPDTGSLTVLSDDFGIPAAANFDSRELLYVVDTARGELVSLDINTGVKRLVAQLSASLDNLAIDSHDQIFVSNMADNGIQEIDPRSGRVRQIIEGRLAIPYAIAVGGRARHDQVFVADLFAFREVDGRTGHVSELARVWEEGTPMNYAINVSANEQHVLLVNSGNLVQRYDARSRALLQSWTLPSASSAVELGDGSLIVLDAMGSLWQVADAPDATPVKLAFSLGGFGSMALASQPTLYAANAASGTLYAVSLADGSSQIIAQQLQRPQSVAVAPDGSIVVAEGGSQRVIAIDPKTAETRVIAHDLPMAIPGTTRSPASVTVGADATIYVTSAAENSIYRLRPLCESSAAQLTAAGATQH